MILTSTPTTSMYVNKEVTEEAFLRCPSCGYESDSERITVTIPPYEGRYCIRCYAAWVATHLPRLETIPAETGPTPTGRGPGAE